MQIPNQVLMACATSLAVSIVGAVATVASSKFPSADWCEKIDREINLHRELEDLAETAKEKLTVEMLRQDIFTKTFRELGYEWREGVPLPRRFAAHGVLICAALSIAMNALEWTAGVQKAPVTGSAITFAVSIALTALLRRWPKTKLNGFYVTEETKRRIAKGIKALQETIDAQELEQTEREYGQPHAVQDKGTDHVEGEEPAERIQEIDDVQPEPPNETV